MEPNRYESFVRCAERVTRVGLQWVFTVREIRALLGEAGFAVLDLLRALDRARFEVARPT